MSISIVIPCFNMQEYLSDAIESALRQDVYEIIVVDDGSIDNSLEIANKYPVKIISQVNKGLSSARNTGIMNADGIYILFLDADDILLDDTVKIIQDIIDETNADIIAPSLKCFGLSNDEVILINNPVLNDFRMGNRIGSCVCIRRSALEKIGGYSSKMLHGYEDLHLIINLLTRGYKIITISKILWLYRVKENSMALTAKDHHKELLDQINYDFPEAKLNF